MIISQAIVCKEVGFSGWQFFLVSLGFFEWVVMVLLDAILALLKLLWLSLSTFFYHFFFVQCYRHSILVVLEKRSRCAPKQELEEGKGGEEEGGKRERENKEGYE